MKKNFTTPNIQVSSFTTENIVLTSGVTVTAVESVQNNAGFSADSSNTTVSVWTEMIKTTL